MKTLPLSLKTLLSLSALTSLALAGCGAGSPTAPASPSPMSTAVPTGSNPASACPLTEAVWAKPPDDTAVNDPPAHGYYFVNEDRSIWASAWWAGYVETDIRVVEEGIKVGWFRPAGAALAITGQRLDGKAPPLESHIPCCYPTRFQATGLMFPTEGCWEVTASADESALSFVVWVEP